MGLHLALLEDEEKQWTIDDILAANLSDRFVLSESKSPNFGHTNSAFWARFKLQNKSTSDKEWLLEVAYPMMQKVDLYIPGNNGSYSLHESGVVVPMNKRDVRNKNFLFHVPVGKRATETFFLRIETESTLVFPLTLWLKDAFYKKDHNEQLIFGFYFGILFVMIFYNLFIYLSLRDVSYLYYVLFVSCHAIYQLFFTGLTQEYIPLLPTEWSLKLALFFAMLFLLANSQFTRKYLFTERYTPKLDKVLLGLAVASGVFAAFFLIINVHTINNNVHIISLVFVITALLTAFLCFKQGFRPAGYYLFAISAFLVGLLFRLFRNTGLLPDTFLTIYMINIGSVIDVTLLSFGLADRINILRQEKEHVIQKSKEQYRRMTQRLLTIQDEERTRLSREIHDSMGEYLTTLLIRCGLMKKKETGKSSEIAGDLDAMKGLINETIDECHRISFELSPPSLSKLGLIPALRELVDGFIERAGVSVEFEAGFDEVRLENEQALMFYRILQESLNNIYNHAVAKQVRIRLFPENGMIRICVSDDGKGFNLDEVMKPDSDLKHSYRGLGLMNMQERAANLGGVLEINSTIGKGTEIAVSIPGETS